MSRRSKRLGRRRRIVARLRRWLRRARRAERSEFDPDGPMTMAGLVRMAEAFDVLDRLARFRAWARAR